MIKVSVIVPVYNVEEYLEKCLNSLVNQTFKEYEVIVVNDGSPDDSQKIIDEFEKKYPKLIKGYKKKNGGLSSARNYGLTKAQGEYISFVDSDDYVTNDYLKKMYDKIIEDKSDIVICDVIKTNTKDEEIISGIDDWKTNDIKSKILLSIPAAWNKLYKKSLFVDNDILYPEGIYYEDLATTGRLVLNAKKISYVRKGLYYYLIREGSIMNQRKYNPKTKDMFTSLDILKKYYIKNKQYKQYKDVFEYLYINNLMHTYIVGIFKYDESYECVKKVHELMKKEYKKWYKNKYFKSHNIKYKIVCHLIYNKQIKIMRLLLK